jgi:hypothetical protein
MKRKSFFAALLCLLFASLLCTAISAFDGGMKTAEAQTHFEQKENEGNQCCMEPAGDSVYAVIKESRFLSDRAGVVQLLVGLR